MTAPNSKPNLNPIVCALTIGCAAILGGGCDTDSVESMFAQAAEETHQAPLSGANEVNEGSEPTHAEARHFAIYNRYRNMAAGASSSGASGESSGESGGESGGVSTEGSDSFLLWGTRLLGIEHLFCPAEGQGK